MVSQNPAQPVDSISDAPAPTIGAPQIPSPVPSISSVTSNDEPSRSRSRLSRPKLGSRKSSGTMIISRDSERVEMTEDEEIYEPDDVRSMSPKRSMETINKLGEDARQHLIEQARMLQASLMAIVDRVELVKEEHEKLEGGNKFLQSYIGELIQTSKITSSLGKSKGKGR